MPTTVQVSAETRRLLEKLKKDMGLESYDDVIGRLAKKQTRMPESLFGACRGSKPFRRESEIEHSL
jgi:predicted CopG family antitoxin